MFSPTVTRYRKPSHLVFNAFSYLNIIIMKTDSQIQKDVMTELKWQPSLKAATIGVAVKDGIVTLSGQVENYMQKQAAERATKKVAGVRAIAEDIQIGVSPAFKRTDAEIAESVLNALRWHSNVPHDNVQVKVDDGVVTLEGEVDWQYQSAAARNAVVALIGVRNVLNDLKVKPQLAAPDIKSRINEALQRAANVDAEKISVDVNGTKVILYGKVRSHAEKEDAEDAAWCAPSVSAVESKLQVEPQMEFAF